MKKKGQFFLIATLLVIIVISGFIALVNYASKSSKSSIREIEKELNIEIEKLMDYGAYNNLGSSEYNVVFRNMSSNYISKFPSKTIIFLYGEGTGDLNVKGINSYEEIIEINTGSGFVNLSTGIGEFEETYTPTSSLVVIKIDETEYSYEFLEGQSFYYLISNKEGGENNIIRN